MSTTMQNEVKNALGMILLFNRENQSDYKLMIDLLKTQNQDGFARYNYAYTTMFGHSGFLGQGKSVAKNITDYERCIDSLHDSVLIPMLERLQQTLKKIMNPMETASKPIDEEVVLSQNNKNHIEKLHPNIRNAAKSMLTNLKKNNIHVEIYSSIRTFEEQNALYAIGRNEDGNVIKGEKPKTNAKGGESNHNFGLAFDIEIYDNDGKKDWNDKGEHWQATIREGIRQGFTSGSTFTDPKNDFPHFENMFGKTITDIKKLYDEGNSTGGFVNVNEM
jgi:hypothetical protein